jgi:hypothetical protein
MGRVLFCKTSDLFIQKIFVILNTRFQQLEILISVLFQFTDSDSQIVVLFKDHCLNELLLLFEPSFKIIIELINLSIHFILQFFKVLLDGSQPAFNILTILLCILKMVS